MLKRFALPAILLAGMIILFFMYRKQHDLYRQTLQLNRQLSSEINKLQDTNTSLQQRIQNIQQANAASKLLHPTFVNPQKYYRQNWKNYIHLSLNKYETGIFGGINNLKIIISNQTDFTLNEATVQISYYKSNGDLFKTENISAKVPARKSITLSAPESPRGTSVKVHFTEIRSSEMNFCWWKDKQVNPEEDDPYRCAGEGVK